MEKKHKILDFHSHLGDIFAFNQNVIYKQNAKFPEDVYNAFDAFSRKGFKGALIDPSNPDEIENIIAATAEACNCNTLENLSKDLDKYGVDYVIMYPCLPWMGFEDYLAASKMDPRIIPFTSADWRLTSKEIGEKLLKDVKNGARGLKIHPILQPICLKDPKVAEVFKYWEETDLPVTSHCGVNSYYKPHMQQFECPENGSLEDFMWAVERFPNIKWVSNHSGGLTGPEPDILGKALGGAPNLWVDTTFRSAEAMTHMVGLFGEDRVLWGTDRPFGLLECCLDEAWKAFGKYTALSEKIMFSNGAKLIKLI